MANNIVLVFSLFFIVFVSELSRAQDTFPDYQNQTYNSKFLPTSEKEEKVSISTYFSPDTSLQTETNLVVNAQSSIDIAIPGFDSWVYCTDSYKGVYGCTVSKQRNQETFPIFGALLNAIHRGVKVRILTNNYYMPNATCTPGYIDPLSFLALAGAQVKYFTTVTYLHSKYMTVDGTTTSISSINFSKTSFTMNREAGVLIRNSNTVTNFTQSVFEYDWDLGINWPTVQYSASDMQIIQDTTPVNVVIPSPTNFPGSYVTDVSNFDDLVSDVTVFTSPDFAFDQVQSDIQNSQSLKVYIYQITNQDWCDFVGNYTGDLTLLVSNEIYDQGDWQSATACYKHLYNNGINIRKTNSKMYTYSHQKYWIIDDSIVYVSTGNWGDTDYPMGPAAFPSYQESPSQWRKTNRDFTIKMVDDDITSVYLELFKEDYERGYDWYPYNH
eukprot:gene10813-13246_t